MSCVTPLGEDSWKLQLFPLVPFPFTDFFLYPFTIINLSCEYNYMLSPESSTITDKKSGNDIEVYQAVD